MPHEGASERPEPQGGPAARVDHLEPWIPILLGAHGLTTLFLTAGPVPVSALSGYLVVVAAGLAGLAGWRGREAAGVRAALTVCVAFAVQVANPQFVPAMLQWYYCLVAVYAVVLRGWGSRLVGTVAAAAYLGQVAAGAGIVPAQVAAARAGVLIALGVLMQSAGQAYRDASARAEARRAEAEQARAQAERARAQAIHRATHDELTGLATRGHFMAQLVERTARTGSRAGGILVCGLDGVKAINSSFGHAFGDQLLVAAAQRLSGVIPVAAGLLDPPLPAEDIVIARISGDEFAVLLPAADAAQAAAVASRVVAAFREPLRLRRQDHTLTVSVGVALLGDQASPAEVVRQAYLALGEAKAAGGARWARPTPGAEQEARRRGWLEQQLRIAVRRHTIDVVYQPVVELGGRRVVGAEALARWTVDGEPVPPDVFIPLAEAAGIMDALGGLVLDRALDALVGWRRAGLGIASVAVNLSGTQLSDAGVVESVLAAVHAHGLGPHSLILEFTESAVAGVTPDRERALELLSSAGVEISLDDFGTGMSSLSRLRRLPVREVKIDRSFVADAGRDDTVLRAVIALAEQMGLRTVAEGVETPDQLARLEALGADRVQGFLLGQPMPAETFARFAAQDEAVRRLASQPGGW